MNHLDRRSHEIDDVEEHCDCVHFIYLNWELAHSNSLLLLLQLLSILIVFISHRCSLTALSFSLLQSCISLREPLHHACWPLLPSLRSLPLPIIPIHCTRRGQPSLCYGKRGTECTPRSLCRSALASCRATWIRAQHSWMRCK